MNLKKTHGRGSLINSHSNRNTFTAQDLSHAPCVHVYRYTKEKFIKRKMYSLALVI